VVVDVRPHLDLFDLDDLLMLARLGGLLLVGVFQLAEIEDLDDRRNGIWGDFDEVEPGFFSRQQCLVDGNIAAVVSVGIDKLNARDTNVEIGAGTVLDWGGSFKRSANGFCLLGPLMMFAGPRLCGGGEREVNSTR